MSVSTDASDLVVEGTADQVTDPATVANLAAIRAARRRVQRAFGRTTAVARLPADRAQRDGGRTIGPGGATRWHF